MPDFLYDIWLDATVDTVKLIPFLFATYLFMEYLEAKMGTHSEKALRKSGKFGPVLGALIGIIPQCGFSAAAASLYSGGVISLGVLAAVFLSTSDEMIPIFISRAVPFEKTAAVLLIKVICAAISGVLIDIVLGRFFPTDDNGRHIHSLCEEEDCRCEDGSIWKSAAVHTAKITVFIYLITFAAALLVHAIGESAMQTIAGAPAGGTFLACLIGLIPNCAASVMITEFYLNGFMTFGQMIAGLLSSSGVGLLVLFRTNRSLRANLKITAALYLISVGWGIVIQVLGVSL